MFHVPVFCIHLPETLDNYSTTFWNQKSILLLSALVEGRLIWGATALSPPFPSLAVWSWASHLPSLDSVFSFTKCTDCSRCFYGSIHFQHSLTLPKLLRVLACFGATCSPKKYYTKSSLFTQEVNDHRKVQTSSNVVPKPLDEAILVARNKNNPS